MDFIDEKGATSSAEALEEIGQRCRSLAATSPENTQKIAADLLAMGKAYYHDACMRAQQSFRVAVAGAIVGTIFLLGSSVFVMKGTADEATFSAIGGGIIEILSAVIFVLHFKAVKQFAYFHVCLERMTRFMVANSVCTNIECHVKRDETRSLLVKTMLDAPMLPLFEDDGRSRRAGKSGTSKAKAVGV